MDALVPSSVAVPGFVDVHIASPHGSKQRASLVYSQCNMTSHGEDPDEVRFLLASDTHIGFMERDPVRGSDSINTFEEILTIARQHRVDFILHGGDLFHENKPSRPTMFKTMALLREYTLGDDPVSIELLSDPYSDSRPGTKFPSVNYEDENFNVSIPFFSIHGNHDDPQGLGEEGSLSALDILSAAGLLNYFGRMTLPSSNASRKRPSSTSSPLLALRPVLLRKGNTHIALYGMGNMKDERISHELMEKHVCMYRPAEATSEWFQVLALHQNRASHNPKAYVPEHILDNSFHLIVWGHEHEQRISPEAVSEKNYHISQPGSSIATSLSPGELSPKSVAIVHVKHKDFKLEPIPLQTARPFVMKDIFLPVEARKEGVDITDRMSVTKLLRSHVESLISTASLQWSERFALIPETERPPPMLPLVRLRVTYDTHLPLGNIVRFGQEFTGRVANPNDVLQLKLIKQRQTQVSRPILSAAHLDQDMLPAEKLERINLPSLVMENVRAQHFDLLNASQLQKSVMGYVEKDERDAIESFLNTSLQAVEQRLARQQMQESQLQSELERICAQQSCVDQPERTAG